MIVLSSTYKQCQYLSFPLFSSKSTMDQQLEFSLASAYKDRQSDTNKFFRKVISLPFVPVRYVRMAWGGLLANMPSGQAYDDFVTYFEGTWLNGNFSLSQWNVYMMDGPRTNNNLEGWHSRVKTLAGKPHLNNPTWKPASSSLPYGVDKTGVDEK